MVRDQAAVSNLNVPLTPKFCTCTNQHILTDSHSTPPKNRLPYPIRICGEKMFNQIVNSELSFLPHHDLPRINYTISIRQWIPLAPIIHHEQFPAYRQYYISSMPKARNCGVARFQCPVAFVNATNFSLSNPMSMRDLSRLTSQTA